MRPADLEAWVLQLIELLDRGARVEDARVELKADWPEPARAARRIAGHANAAHGDPILWVIGVDEHRLGLPEHPAATVGFGARSFALVPPRSP